MPDKKEKLAAAKKRLKQFQAQSQGTGTTTPPAAEQPNSAQQRDPAAYAEIVPAAPNSDSNAATTPASTAVSSLQSAIPCNGIESNVAVAEQVNQHGRNTAALEADLAALQAALIAAQTANLAERSRNETLCTELQKLQQQQQRATIPTSTTSNQQHQHANRNAAAGDLQQQLNAHAQTIAVLVGEKSDLAAGLAKFQQLAREKITAVEELQGRLNASRHRVQTLERDLGTGREAAHQVELSQQRLCTELETVQEALRAAQRNSEEMLDERAELRQQLIVRRDETAALQQQLEAVQRDLALQQLKVAQLSGGGDDADAANVTGAPAAATIAAADLEKTVGEQQQHIGELQLALDRLQVERDQSGEQYQMYVQQLTTDNARLGQQLHEYAEQNGKLEQREASLVLHMGELERQMQQQMAKQASLAALQPQSSDVNEPNAEHDVAAPLLRENETLSETVKQQTEEISALREQLVDRELLTDRIGELESLLERMQAERPDAKSLLGTMQSDKATASRAVSQNVELKQQLEELQKAFVQLSNDKLELTERLQSEQYLGRENKANADQRLEEMTSVKQKLHFKDEEMIRLSHECEERKKEVLQLTQEVDRLQHYVSKAQSNAIVQQQANSTIARLREQIAHLQNTSAAFEPVPAANADDAGQPSPSHRPDSEATTAVDADDVAIEASETDGIEEVAADEPTSGSTTPPQVFSNSHIPTEEAMEKLQERFTRTMSDIADLTEEKNRLEHLCTQLQGETETIGEYIALYQCQRQQLKQRERERDVQMQTIVSDREEMRLKLVQLNALVERLIGANVQTVGQQTQSTPTSETDDEAPEDGATAAVMAPNSSSTATEILHLLGEIQDRNQRKEVCPETSQDVHKCACCYGKLETV